MKNTRIQFWRIVFTYIVALYHLKNVYGQYTSWYIAVEFFFIVSGYLIAKKYFFLKENGILKADYVLTEFKKTYINFFPHALFAFAVSALGIGLFSGYSINDFLTGFITHLPEIFLFQSIGLNWKAGFAYNSVSWYLSTVLIAGFLIRFLLSKNDRIYIKIVCPLSVLLIYPYLWKTYGYIGEHWDCVSIVLNSALLRGFTDMNLGIIGFKAAELLKTINGWILAVLSSVCLILGGIVIPTFFYQTAYDFLLVFILFFGVTAAFACDGETNRCFNNELIRKWASITPSIYLNHKIFRNVFRLLFPEYRITVVILWFLFITVYSFLTHHVIRSIIGKIKILMNKRYRTGEFNE